MNDAPDEDVLPLLPDEHLDRVAEGTVVQAVELTKEMIIARIRALGLPDGSFVAFGSCPLAIVGIRPAKDIDLLVSKEIYALLARSGWKKIQKGPDDTPLVHDIFEAHEHWDFSPYRPTLEQLLRSATIIEGIPFASLAEVRAWKAASGGEKHLRDVALIDAYLQQS